MNFAFTVISNQQKTDMWYTCTVGSFIASSAMLLKKMRVGQSVKERIQHFIRLSDDIHGC